MGGTCRRAIPVAFLLAAFCSAQTNNLLPPAPTLTVAPGAPDQTTADKWSLCLVEIFGPRALLEPLFPAILRMGLPPDRYPRDWRQGVPGLARNYGASWATRAVFQTARTASGTLLHEDLRYHPAITKSPAGRFGHALAYGFVDRSDTGQPRIAWSNFIGVAAASYSGLLYRPSGFNDVSHANTGIAISFAFVELHNLAREFSPDLLRLKGKLHLGSGQAIPEWWTATPPR